MELSQKQIQEQTQELHTIQSQVQEIDEKLDQVLTILTGNELDKEAGGMIKTVRQHESRIASLEKTRDRLVVALVVLSFCTGITFWDMIQTFFKK